MSAWPKKKATPPGCEVDYWHVLTPEQRRWLKQFNDESGQGYFSKKKQSIHSEAQKRAIWNSCAASRRDFFAKVKRTPLADHHGGNYSPELEEAIDNANLMARLSDYAKKPRQ